MAQYRLGVFDENGNELNVRLGRLSDVVWDDKDCDGDAWFQADQNILYNISKHTRSTLPKGSEIRVVGVMNKPSMSMEEFEKRVVDVAKSRLQGKKWFRGVCMDGIKDFYNKEDLSGAINHVIFNTEYHDNWV